MALLQLEGFDAGVLPDTTWTLVNGVNVTYVTGRAAGSLCINCQDNNYGELNKALTAMSELTTSWAWRYLGSNGSTAWQDTYPLFALNEGATVHLQLRLTLTGALELRNGAGTLLGSAPLGIDVNLGSWIHVGVHARIADSGGYCRVDVNGTKVIEFTGDTRNGGTGVVDKLRWAWAIGGACLDDFVLGDTTGPAPYNALLGDTRVQTLRPTGNGAASSWAGSDGNAVDNWQLVDDNATTTDYVESATVGARDLYELGDLTGADVGQVLAVQVAAYVAKSDTGDAAGPLLAVERLADGTVRTSVAATTAQIGTTYSWRGGSIQTTAPDAGAWTAAKIAGLQAGVEVGTP